MANRRSLPRPSRGFTLIELMAVVTITAILALVGVSLFRHQLLASKGTEAAGIIQAIRSAEEAYSAENHVYLNVSTGGGATTAFASKWYPILTPNTASFAWVQPGHVDYPRWRALAPSVNRSVTFGYLVYAGAAGSNVPALALAQDPGFPKPMILDWYVIQARGDTDGNSVFAQYAASSRNSELVVENEGE